MTSIVGSIVNGGSGSSAFTLTNGSATGRAVVVLATQNRNPVSLAGTDFSIDSVGPSQTLGIATGSGNGERTLAMIWEDADLPATGGSYTLSSSAQLSTRYSIYELSDAETSSIEVISAGLASGFADPLVVNFTTTDANSILFLVFRQSNGFGSDIGAGDSTDQTVDNVDAFYYIGHEVDTNADAQMSIDGNINNGGDAAYTALGINSLSGGSGPTLETIPATAYNGQPRTIAVTGAGATRGTGSVTIGGVAQTVTSWSDTSITFTTVQGDEKFEAGKTVTLTTDAGDTATGTIELVVEPGTGGFVDVVDPATTEQSSFAFQVEDAGGNPVETGDQFQWRYTGVEGDPTSMTVGADTLITSVDTDGSVDGRFWDATDSTWGAWETFSTVDQSPSVIDSVSVPTAGTYIVSEALSFTVNWNEAVDVTGTPALNLNVGGSARQANYASGTGTTALVFSYTVQSGDEDTDGISVTSLTLDGGTIKDAAGNDATLTLNTVGDTSGVQIDGVSPVISINPLTTLDTSPIVSGSAGDAVSLTLAVNGQTYNPTPSGGSWNQQLPTLALGDYTMTLNGTDAAGNAAVEATGTLSVVAELPSVVFGLIGSAIEPVISNALEDSIG